MPLTHQPGPNGHWKSAVPAQILRALRAGRMTALEMQERWSFYGNHLKALKDEGLIREVEDSAYEITARGMEACPPRNPASTRPRALPHMGAHVRGPTGMAPKPPRIRSYW